MPRPPMLLSPRYMFVVSLFGLPYTLNSSRHYLKWKILRRKKKGITNQACKKEFFADWMNRRFQRQLIRRKFLGVSGNEALLNPGVVKWYCQYWLTLFLQGYQCLSSIQRFIESLSFNHRRQTLISGAYPPVVPIPMKYLKMRVSTSSTVIFSVSCLP